MKHSNQSHLDLAIWKSLLFEWKAEVKMTDKKSVVVLSYMEIQEDEKLSGKLIQIFNHAA